VFVLFPGTSAMSDIGVKSSCDLSVVGPATCRGPASTLAVGLAPPAPVDASQQLLRELEALAATRHPTAAAYVMANSGTFVVALADDPAASWVSALPLAASGEAPALAFERCLELLALLERLQAEPTPPPRRILRIRHRSLFDALDGATGADLAELAHLAEYLQLPKSITLRLNQQAAARAQLDVATHEAGALWTWLVHEDQAVLTPFVEDVKAIVRTIDDTLYPRLRGCRVILSSDAFMAGMEGLPWDSTKALVVDMAEPSVPPALFSLGCIAGGYPCPTLSDLGLTDEGCPNRAAPLRAAVVLGELGVLQSLVAQLPADTWSPARLRAAGGDPSARDLARSLMQAVGAGGHIPVAQWLAEKCPALFEEPRISLCDRSVLIHCAGSRRRHTSFIKWAFDALPATAFGLGDLECLCMKNPDAALHVLEHATHKLPAGWQYATEMHHAVEGGVDVLERLHRAGCRLSADLFIREAAREASWQALQWARGKGIHLVPEHLATVASHCDPAMALAALRWLHAEGLCRAWDAAKWSAVGLDAATERLGRNESRLALLQWLQPFGCTWDERAVAAAAERGDLATLQWLRGIGCLWDATATAAAASGRHLPTLQWLHANGCPSGVTTTAAAASAGDLPMLQWLHLAGCLRDWTAAAAAAKIGSTTILTWLQATSCPLDSRIATAAARDGDLPMLQWLRANGCPWDADTAAAAAEDDPTELHIYTDTLIWYGDERRLKHLRLLQWMRAQEPPCPWDSRVIDSAMREPVNQPLWDWARDNGCPVYDGPAF